MALFVNIMWHCPIVNYFVTLYTSAPVIYKDGFSCVQYMCLQVT